MNIAEKIKRQRKANGLNQEELAERLGLSITTIRRWEWGRRAPNAVILPKLAEVLNTSVAYLMGLDEDTATAQPVTQSPPAETKPVEDVTPPPGLDYWGGVVENARKAAVHGRDLKLIILMLKEALAILEATHHETREVTPSPANAGAISA